MLNISIMRGTLSVLLTEIEIYYFTASSNEVTVQLCTNDCNCFLKPNERMICTFLLVCNCY